MARIGGAEDGMIRGKGGRKGGGGGVRRGEDIFELPKPLNPPLSHSAPLEMCCTVPLSK